MSKIGTVISFCTHDVRFLDRNINAVRPFSSQIVIPVCDHFYNGKPENLELLQKIYHHYPDVDFVQFAYSEEEVYGTPAKLVPGSPDWAQHWHNSARLIGSYFLKPEIDYALFVDADEIFTSAIPPNDYDALRFATYWYFKTVSKRATVTPDGPLLIRKSQLTTELLLNPHERMGMFEHATGRKEREYCIDGKPIVHHYSWVRTPEEMLNKVRSWGHHWERDWEKLLQSEGDFVRKYEYQEAEVAWDPLGEDPKYSEIQNIITNISQVTPREIFRMGLQNQINS